MVGRGGHGERGGEGGWVERFVGVVEVGGGGWDEWDCEGGRRE